MKDFLQSVYDSSRERIKNPLIVSFIISWCIYNWNSLLILTSGDLHLTERIEIVRPKNGFFESGFFIPLLFAILYVTVFPYFFWILDRITKHSYQIRKTQAKNKRLEDLVVTKEIAKAELEIAQYRIENKNISELTEEVESLQTSLNFSQEENKKLLNQVESLKQIEQDLNNKLLEMKPSKEPTLSKNEVKRLNNRLYREMNATLAELIEEFAKRLYNDLEKPPEVKTSMLIELFDKFSSSSDTVIAKYKDIETIELSNKISFLLGQLEDNIKDATSRIQQAGGNLSKTRVALRSIFGPLFALLDGQK